MILKGKIFPCLLLALSLQAASADRRGSYGRFIRQARNAVATTTGSADSSTVTVVYSVNDIHENHTTGLCPYLLFILTRHLSDSKDSSSCRCYG